MPRLPPDTIGCACRTNPGPPFQPRGERPEPASPRDDAQVYTLRNLAMKTRLLCYLLTPRVTAPGARLCQPRHVPENSAPSLPWSLGTAARGVTWLCLALAALLNSSAQTVNSVLTNRLKEPYAVAVDANIYYITD